MKKRIKIMYIIPAEGFGGAERQAILHINHLCSYGIEVVAVTGPGKKVFERLDANVHFCPHLPAEYGRPFSFFPFLRHVFKAIVAWIRSCALLVKLIRKEDVDLIFASRVVGWSLAGPLSLRLGIPAIWRFGSRAQGWPRHLALKGLALLGKPAAVVSNCKAVAESASGAIDVPEFLVPNGIDERCYDLDSVKFSLRERLGIEVAVPIVGLAVRPSPDKGMDFLAEIIQHIKQKGKPVRFCIAGEFGWRATIEQEFANRGLGNDVTFLGHVSDMVSFFAGCDIVALTSREHSIEGFPNSLLEAMALARPVIATAVGGVPELVEHGKTGLLIPGHDSRRFAEALIDLLENPQARARLGQQASRVVRERFSIDNTVQSLASCIKRVLAGQTVLETELKPLPSSSL